MGNEQYARGNRHFFYFHRMKECLNCHLNITADAKFCSHCGQKTRPGKLTLWEFFKIFFDTYFNLDSTVFRTVRDLFIPGRLTVKFFEGKRKSYFHPLRTFLLTAGFFIAMLGSHINNYVSAEAEKLSKGLHEYFVKQETLSEIDSMQHVYFDENLECKTINLHDSLRMKYKTQILDSLNQKNSITIENGSGEVINMKLEEIYAKSADELIEELELTDWKSKMSVQQMKKLVDNPNGLIRSSIGNLIWMVLLLMPVIALFLKLIYFRHGHYFVEHLVFSFHFNSFAFLIMGLVLWIFDASGTAILYANLVIIIFLILAMKLYYQQSKRKTFLKWFLLLWGYFFSVFFFLTIMLIFSFFIF